LFDHVLVALFSLATHRARHIKSVNKISMEKLKRSLDVDPFLKSFKKNAHTC